MEARKWFLTGIVSFGILTLYSSLAPAEPYYACMNNSDGTIYVVALQTPCKKNETKISWDEEGQMGPQGPAGSQGEPGPAGPTNSVFVRWGNDTALAGTTLLYGGKVFSGAALSQGSGTPICLANGYIGTNPHPYSYFNDALFPVALAINPSNPYALKCAVVLADGMTTVIWGSSVAPEGWDVLYSGAVAGASYYTANPLDRICLDKNYDNSTPSFGQGYYYLSNWMNSVMTVDCAVIVKRY